MSTHNICFHREIRKILRGYPLLSVAMIYTRGIVKDEYLVIILVKFSPILHKNMYCGYSLEASHRGTSNEYNSMCFHREKRKKFPDLSSDMPP